MLTEKKIRADIKKMIGKAHSMWDGNGLKLQVTPNGSASWLFRYQLNNRRREIGLGAYPSISLQGARMRAAEARVMVHNKIDPIDQRQAKKAAIAAVVADDAARAVTFRDVAEDYMRSNRPAWRNVKHAAQWQNTVSTYAYPIIGDKPVRDVDEALVLEILTPIWLSKTETAKRLRGRIETILDAAKVKKLRSGENPARWRGHLDKLLPAPNKIAPVKHHPALPYDQVKDFMAKLRKSTGTSALCLEFVILTACRSGEALKATWSEIDEANGVWVIPAARMKAGNEHRVPLSPSVKKVLEKAKEYKQSDFIFPNVRLAKPMSDMSLTVLLRRLHPGVTTHGFRSSFRDWAAEVTHYPNEMAEMALAHVVGNKVEAAYRRGDMFDRRRQMMDDWATWCEPKVEENNVVPISSKTAA